MFHEVVTENRQLSSGIDLPRTVQRPVLCNHDNDQFVTGSNEAAKLASKALRLYDNLANIRVRRTTTERALH